MLTGRGAQVCVEITNLDKKTVLTHVVQVCHGRMPRVIYLKVLEIIHQCFEDMNEWSVVYKVENLSLYTPREMVLHYELTIWLVPSKQPGAILMQLLPGNHLRYERVYRR